MMIDGCTHRDTRTHAHTYMHTHMHRHTRTHTSTHTHAHPATQSHTRTYTRTPPTHARAYAHIHIHNNVVFKEIIRGWLLVFQRRESEGKIMYRIVRLVILSRYKIKNNVKAKQRVNGTSHFYWAIVTVSTARLVTVTREQCSVLSLNIGSPMEVQRVVTVITILPSTVDWS